LVEYVKRLFLMNSILEDGPPVGKVTFHSNCCFETWNFYWEALWGK